MRTLFYIVAVTYSFLLVGCANTEGTIDIGGKVIDVYSKEGTPKRVVIVQGMINTDSGLTPAGSFGRFYTDSLGHFKYTLKKTKDAYWYDFVFLGDSTYSYSTHKVSLNELERNSKFLSFSLEKLTDFTFKIVRNKHTIPFDTLCISWKTNGIDGRIFPYRVINYGVAPHLELMWIGGNVNSIIETKILANKSTIVHMNLFCNGSVKEMADTIFCYRDVKNYFTFKY